MKQKLLSFLFMLMPIWAYAQTELLTNGGFETWVDDLPAEWKSTTTASSATLKQSTDAHSGSYAVIVINATSNKRLAYKELDLKAGTYTFSFYVKSAEIDTLGSVRPGYVPITDGKAGTYTYGDIVDDVTNDWKKVSYEFTLLAPTTVNLVVMNSKTDEKKGKIYADLIIDDASLTTTNGGINDGTGDEEPTTQMSYIFTKVTSLASMVNEGQYIIGANLDGTIKVAQNLASNKNYGYLNTEDAQEVDGKITLTSKANTFTVKGTNIIDTYGRYLYQSGTYNNFNVGTDATQEGINWGVEFQEDGTVKIINATVGKFVQYTTSYKTYGSYAELGEGNFLPSLYLLTDSVEEDITPVVTPISTIAEVQAAPAGLCKIEGVVMALSASGAVIGDETGYIYLYDNSFASEVGDKVQIEGTTSSYGGFMQFSSSEGYELVKTGTSAVEHPEAVQLDGAAMDAWVKTPVIQYVQYTGTLTVSGKYYNVAVDGAATAIGSIVSPTDALKEKLVDGATLTFTGYAMYINSGKYINTIVTDVAETTGINVIENQLTQKAIYDLQGRKVENPTQGLYIIDGRKVMVK